MQVFKWQPNTMNRFHHFLFITFLFYIATAQSADPLGNSCNDNSKINGNSQISRNLDSLLSILVQGTIQNGFLATSYGKGGDQIYGLAQCRGDVSKEDCSICIKDASRESRKVCPNQTDVRIWYDYCFLKYNTVKFFGEVDTSVGIFYWNVQNVTDVDDFNKKLGSLVDKIDSEAVKPANKGLGKGKSEISPFLTLHALVQCTSDLSPINCAQCLAIAIGDFHTFCDNKRGCRVLYGSCYVRYELYPFFFPLDSQESSGHNPVNYRSFKAYKP